MKTRALIERIIAAALVSLSTSSIVLAQGSVGAIGGIAIDLSGAVLPGVTVILSNPGTIGGNQTTVTDARGAYQFTRLVPGTYAVRATLPGFRTALQQNVVVNSDVTARVDVKLEIGGNTVAFRHEHVI